MITSFAGASAAPSQAPAASAQTMPSLCSERDECPVAAVELSLTNSLENHQQAGSENEYGHRHPEMHVGEYGD